MTDYDSADDKTGGESYKNEQTLRRLYWGEELPTREVAKRLGCTKGAILDWMQEHGIERRSRSEPKYPKLDGQTLSRLYHDEGLSSPEIAERFGCSDGTVRRRMEKCGIDRRGRPEAQRNPCPELDEQALREHYREEHLSLKEIADRFGCSRTTVFERCVEYDVELRSPGEWNAYRAASTPAPFRTKADGYEKWQPSVGGKKRYVPVHRLLAVSEFGFDAVCDMDVHHGKEAGALPAAEIPWANWPGNLELMSHGDHSQYHGRE